MYKLKVAIITNIITTYRQGFYDRLFKRDDLFVKVYCQDNMPGMNLVSIHERYPHNVKIVKFLSAKREKIGWQFLPWHEIISDFDVIFVAGNPRVLSDVFFGTYLRLTQKKVVLWTMAHSFRNNKFTENIRLFWSRIFKYIFVYTDKEVDFLRTKGFNSQVILGMNNGLDQKRIDYEILKWNNKKLNLWRRNNNFQDKIMLLSSARLESKNKFEQVILALPDILIEHPNVIWCIVGKGTEEQKLKYLVKENNMSNYVRFVGEIYDESNLAPWFLTSELFIQPAAMGLSLLHAFGYGLPVVTNDNSLKHGPEYAAFTENLTGKEYRYNDTESLANAVIHLLKSPTKRARMKDNNQRIVREKYNVDIMVERFVAISNKAYNK